MFLCQLDSVSQTSLSYTRISGSHSDCSERYSIAAMVDVKINSQDKKNKFKLPDYTLLNKPPSQKGSQALLKKKNYKNRTDEMHQTEEETNKKSSPININDIPYSPFNKKTANIHVFHPLRLSIPKENKFNASLTILKRENTSFVRCKISVLDLFEYLSNRKDIIQESYMHMNLTGIICSILRHIRKDTIFH